MPGGGLDCVREVVLAAAAGEAAATDAVERVALWMGTGLASVVNVFNPQAVILGGAFGEIYAAAAATVQSAVVAAALHPPREELRLLQPAFGTDSSLVGAAELAFTPLLADPLLEMARLTA